MTDLRVRFEATVLPHLDAAYRLARWLSPSAAEADDLVQDAVLRAFRGFDRLRAPDAKAWLLAIVRNCHRTSARQRRRHPAEPLPEDFREVLLLREVEDLSYREIAEVTAIPIGTVMSRLSRARALLRERLGRSAEGALHVVP